MVLTKRFLTLVLLALSAACSGDDEDPPLEPAFELECAHYQQTKIKCSVLVQGKSGPILDKTLGDFTVTEALVDGAVVETNTVTFEDSPSYQFEGDGFWEESLSAAKTDIVFLIDNSSTMGDARTATRTAVEGLVDQLMSAHVDFRMRFVHLDTGPDAIYGRPFRTSMELAEIQDDLVLMTNGEGEGYNSPVVYDALMLAMGNPADWSEFRPDAKPLIVVVTDSVPANVFGRTWYPPSSTSATPAAFVERLARWEANGGAPITLRYSVASTAGTSQDASAASCSEPFSPKACELGYDRFGSALQWPPAADDLFGAVDDLFDASLADMAVEESNYHFAWLINFDRGQLAPGRFVEVTVQTTVDGEPMSATQRLPAKAELGELTVVTRGEDGEASHSMTFELYDVLGSRRYLTAWDKTIGDGENSFELTCGEKMMWLRSGSYPKADYETMRYGWIGMVDPCAQPRLEFDLRWADRPTDVSIARGLVDELATWGPIDRPFGEVADAIDTWLDDLDAAMTWVEYAQLKRLIVSLGAYLNTTGYATVQVESAAKDFTAASTELRNLIREMDDTKNETQTSTFSEATLALLTFYSTPPNVNADAIAKHETEVIAVDAIVDYLTGPFLTEALTAIGGVISENVNNGELAGIIIQFASALVSGEWDDLDDLILRLAQVGLEAALNETVDRVAGAVGELVADEIDAVADPQATTAVKRLVKRAVAVVLDAGLDAFKSAITGSAQAELDDLATTAQNELGSREALVDAIDLVFAQVQSRLEYGEFRNFVWPMLHTLVRALVEKDEVDTGFILGALATQFANRLIVYPYYADPMDSSLRDILQTAKSWQPAGGFHDEAHAINVATALCRADTMRPLNNEAWRVLATQRSIDNWENWMTAGRSILGVLEAATIAGCVYYPDMCDAATDDIPTLMSVLSGLRLLTNIFQLAIRMNMLEEMADWADDCDAVLFP